MSPPASPTIAQTRRCSFRSFSTKWGGGFFVTSVFLLVVLSPSNAFTVQPSRTAPMPLKGKNPGRAVPGFSGIRLESVWSRDFLDRWTARRRELVADNLKAAVLSGALAAGPRTQGGWYWRVGLFGHTRRSSRPSCLLLAPTLPVADRTFLHKRPRPSLSQNISRPQLPSPARARFERLKRVKGERLARVPRRPNHPAGLLQR